MNSKERVLKAIAHEEPDRVPIGEWGIDHDHVSRILGRHTFWRNRKDITLALWEGRRDEVVEGLKRDYVELIETLDYDVVPVMLVPAKAPAPDDAPREVRPGEWHDSAGRIYKHAASNDSIICVTPPPARRRIGDDQIAKMFEKIEEIDESQFELIDHIADRFAQTRALVFRGLNAAGSMMGAFGGDAAHRLMMTALAEEEFLKMHDVVVERNVRILERCARKGVVIAMEGHDYGSTHGCMMAPATIRRLFMPAHKRIAAAARKLGMIPFFHCCGSIWDILDDWVDAGYVGYQSIQETAGMDLKTVCEKYGRKLTLWTGVQCETLVEGTLEQVEAEIRRSLDICMEGGGFIFGSTNSVQYGAKTENYLKALEIVRECGRYGNGR